MMTALPRGPETPGGEPQAPIPPWQSRPAPCPTAPPPPGDNGWVRTQGVDSAEEEEGT